MKKILPFSLFAFLIFASAAIAAGSEIASKAYVDSLILAIPAGAPGTKGDTGATGETGESGREIELQKSSTHLQWRYVGEESWEDLAPLSDLGFQNPSSEGMYVMDVNGSGEASWKEIEIKDQFEE